MARGLRLAGGGAWRTASLQLRQGAAGGRRDGTRRGSAGSLVQSKRETLKVWQAFQRQHRAYFGQTLHKADEPQALRKSEFALCGLPVGQLLAERQRPRFPPRSSHRTYEFRASRVGAVSERRRRTRGEWQRDPDARDGAPRGKRNSGLPAVAGPWRPDRRCRHR